MLQKTPQAAIGGKWGFFMSTRNQHDTDIDFAISGELSDAAIDALAALLVELAEAEVTEQ